MYDKFMTTLSGCWRMLMKKRIFTTFSLNNRQEIGKHWQIRSSICHFGRHTLNLVCTSMKTWSSFICVKVMWNYLSYHHHHTEHAVWDLSARATAWRIVNIIIPALRQWTSPLVNRLHQQDHHHLWLRVWSLWVAPMNIIIIILL